jgi:hypothetical protein
VQERKTNVDIEALATSPLVGAYMLRVIDDYRDPLTRHVFAVVLARAAADAFDLYSDDGVAFASVFLAIAADVRDGSTTPLRAAFIGDDAR